MYDNLSRDICLHRGGRVTGREDLNLYHRHSVHGTVPGFAVLKLLPCNFSLFLVRLEEQPP